MAHSRPKPAYGISGVLVNAGVDCGTMDGVLTTVNAKVDCGRSVFTIVWVDVEVGRC